MRAATLSLLGATLATAAVLEERAACPQLHIFGARETTAPPGFGTAGPVVQSIMNAFPGSTSEVINYPACGGQASCGGVSYANSVIQGIQGATNQIDTFKHST